ncbi:MAG: VanW family protein [Clostridia bacterium]|nr:VanW family protein [Clostridia bacterium]
MSIFDPKSKSAKTAVILTVILISLIISAVFVYYAIKASANKIYDGIKVGNINLGDMDKSSATKILMKKYNTDNLKITINCDGYVFDISGSDFSLKPDYEATAKKALYYGKTGSVFTKIKNMLSLSKAPHNIPLIVNCDTNALQFIISQKLGNLLYDTIEHYVEIGENQLIVSNGKNGKTVSANKILNAISDAITKNNIPISIKIHPEAKAPKPIDPDEFIKKYNCEPQNATVQEADNKITITPEIIGIKIDSKLARKILAENANATEKYSIPAIISYPQITAKFLEEEYTDTIIATYSTNYASGSENRKTNIHLASDKINGLVLNPGDTFSFNSVVGPRSLENGYKTAQSYSGSKVVEDLGGGICQVSSTLYNAAVFADLEIVSRTNHTMPVSYTPLGRDATVSYNSIDFKFKNNKNTPVKLEILYNGATLTVNVYGRKKYIKDIQIETKISGSIPFTIDEINDDTLPEGETKTVEAGSNGTIVDSYKLEKVDGQIVSRTLLARSIYTPRPKIMKIGTKKADSLPQSANSR